MTGTPIHLTDELRDYIRDELGTKAHNMFKEAGRGCWIFPRSDIVSFIPVANIGTIYGPNYPEETAALLMMISQYNPESQIVIIVSVKRGQQILSIVNLR